MFELMAFFKRRARNADDQHVATHYSQLGEDIVLQHYLREVIRKTDPGFYIDVGAHHPFKYSNTAALYAAGWHGINIDVAPRAIELFKSARPRDVSLCRGVARVAGTRPFYEFEIDAASTLDEATKDRFLEKGWRLRTVVDVDVAPLSTILQPHLTAETVVDYLNVDIEGLDQDALETYDFDRFPPSIITIEIHDLDLATPKDNPSVDWLLRRGYTFVSHTVVTAVFIRDQFAVRRAS